MNLDDRVVKWICFLIGCDLHAMLIDKSKCYVYKTVFYAFGYWVLFHNQLIIYIFEVVTVLRAVVRLLIYKTICIAYYNMHVSLYPVGEINLNIECMVNVLSF